MSKNKNIWQTLPKPFFVLAPMDDVTDTVFRQIMARIGKPDLFFTEFTNVDGLVTAKGHQALMPRFNFTEVEKPIIAQLWGKTPEHYFKVAQELSQMGFDGIDLNMGCPVDNVVRSGNCSALINNQSLAQEIIQATQEGAGGLPVSVKTRIGFRQIQTEEWIGFLLAQNLAALTVHGRTAKEMSKVPAHWEEIKKVVQMRNELSPQTVIVGNGDVKDRVDGQAKALESGVDGLMVGRGVFENLWAFNPDFQTEQPNLEVRLKILLEHTDLFEKTWGEKTNFASMRKFYKAYLHGLAEIKVLREELLATNSPAEVHKIIKSYSRTLAPTKSILGKTDLT